MIENKGKGNSQRKTKMKPKRNEKVIDDRKSNSNSAKNPLVDSFWLRALVWMREQYASGIFSFTYFSRPPVPITKSSTIIVFVLLVAIVFPHRDSLFEAMGVTTALSDAAKIILYTAAAALVLLVYLLWWLISNGTQSQEKTEEIDEKDEGPLGIDDELTIVSPLGLKQSSAISFGNTNESAIEALESDVQYSPQLASSKNVRIKLAEWLPYSLRHTSDLNLVFSTDVHGRSLQTLYHILETTRSNHTIMLMEIYPIIPSIRNREETKTIIGMYASQRWHLSS